MLNSKKVHSHDAHRRCVAARLTGTKRAWFPQIDVLAENCCRKHLANLLNEESDGKCVMQDDLRLGLSRSFYIGLAQGSRPPFRRKAFTVSSPLTQRIVLGDGSFFGRRAVCGLLFSSDAPFWSDSVSRLLGFFDKIGQVYSDSVRNTQHQFERWISKSPLNQTQHGFRDPGTLRHDVIREPSTLAFEAQKSNNFLSYRFVMSDAGHDEASQNIGLDRNFAIVKYRAAGRRKRSIRQRNRNKIPGGQRIKLGERAST